MLNFYLNLLLLLIPTKHGILQWESDDHKGMYCPGPKILTFKLKKKQRKESKRKVPLPLGISLWSAKCVCIVLLIFKFYWIRVKTKFSCHCKVCIKICSHPVNSKIKIWQN